MQAQNEDPVVIRKEPGKINPELYSFYENLPAYKIINAPKSVTDPPVRIAIMSILREGIDDTDTQLRRHALNAREIKQKLKEHENNEAKKISYTNLYFHLNKLQEIGAIQTVALVIEKSHRIAYYGRTARVIFKRDPEKESQEHFREMFAEFGKLVKILHPDTGIERINDLADKYYSHKRKRTADLIRWLASNEEIIRREGISFEIIDKVINIMDASDPEYRAILDELARFLP